MFTLPNGSIVKVHDIFDPLPEFMLQADTIFTDIPYNQSLLTNFSYRPEVVLSPNNTIKFDAFTTRFFECIKQIAPLFLFVETGKEALADYIIQARDIYKYITFYNSTYYHSSLNRSYIIHATNNYKLRRYAELEDVDEEDVISWLCQNHQYNVIGDLCMGKGLVGIAAYKAGKPFVGTEFNKRRLACLLQSVEKLGATVKRIE